MLFCALPPPPPPHAFSLQAWDLLAVCNGALVGFVSITASSNVIEPWAGILAGFVGGWIFDATCALFLKLKIDDPLSAAPMHGICGMWGVFFAGLLSKYEYILESYGSSGPTRVYNVPQGLFYKGNGRLLACQCIGILAITAWVCGMMGLFFYVFKLVGKLRISPEEEQAGLDVSKHGGSAYNYDHGLVSASVWVHERVGARARGAQRCPARPRGPPGMHACMHAHTGAWPRPACMRAVISQLPRLLLALYGPPGACSSGPLCPFATGAHLLPAASAFVSLSPAEEGQRGRPRCYWPVDAAQALALAA